MTSPQTPGYAIGVDLGTSNTVAVVRSPDGRTRPLLFDGQPILPSVVYLDEQGRIHVGRDAHRMAQLDPARCEPHPKRRIDEGVILLGDREVPVVALLAAILKAIADKAVETVGFLPPAAITHPAAWAATRRGVLTEAVRQAGWPPVLLVPEPIAAARYFAQVMRRPVPVGSSLAVFDFGGGTLDVAVVRHEQDGRFTVTASGGDGTLGGLDLDAALVDHVGAVIAQRRPDIWQHLSRPESTADRRYRRLFWEDVRGAKEMLSRTAAAPVPVPGVDNAVHLTREEAERITGPLLQRAVTATRATLGQARVRPDQLSGLFLVGGSSRVPLVARLLHAQLGIAPTVLEQPELPVAEGALAELAPAAEDATQLAQRTGGVSYPASAVPASGIPVSAMPGQSSPVSAVPTTPGAGPVSGGPPGPYPPAGPPPGGDYGALAPPPPPPWYRRKHVVLPLAAAAVVLALIGGFLVFYNPYDERGFTTLDPVATAKYPVDTPDDTWTRVVDGVGYVATLSTSSGDDFSGSSDHIWLRAVDLASPKKPLWTREYDTPHGSSWINGLQIAGGVIVLAYDDTTDDEYHTVSGGMWVLDQKSGRKLWGTTTTSDDGDGWEAEPDGAVVHWSTAKATVTGYDARRRHIRWKLPHAVGRPMFDESYEGYSGPAGFTYSWNSVPAARSSTRVVTVQDNVARVYDTDKPSKAAGTRRLSDGGFRLVYDGVLYDASPDSGYSLSAYSLDKLGDSKWSPAADPGWRPVRMDVCGRSLLCVSETRKTADDAPAQRITAWGTDGQQKWHYNAPNNQGAVPVGNRIVVSYKSASGALVTDVLDDDGDRKKQWSGEAARVDDAEVLVSAADVYGGITSDAEGDAAGKTLSGDGVQSLGEHTLGILAEDPDDCGWDSRYLVCANDEAGKFVAYDFR